MVLTKLKFIFKYFLYIILFLVLYCSYSINATKELIDGTGLAWEIIMYESNGDEEGTATLEISIANKNGVLGLPNYLKPGTAPWRNTSDGTVANSEVGKITWSRFPSEQGKVKDQTGKIYRVTRLILPHGLTTIGEGAFMHFHYLNNLVIPESTVSIGNCAFQECYISNIVLLGNVASVNQNAFQGLPDSGTLYSASQDVSSFISKLPYVSNEVKWVPKDITDYKFDDVISNNGDSNVKIKYSGQDTKISVPINDWEKSMSSYARIKKQTANGFFSDANYVAISGNDAKLTVEHPGVYTVDKIYVISDKKYKLDTTEGKLVEVNDVQL